MEEDIAESLYAMTPLWQMSGEVERQQTTLSDVHSVHAVNMFNGCNMLNNFFRNSFGGKDQHIICVIKHDFISSESNTDNSIPRKHSFCLSSHIFFIDISNVPPRYMKSMQLKVMQFL